MVSSGLLSKLFRQRRRSTPFDDGTAANLAAGGSSICHDLRWTETCADKAGTREVGNASSRRNTQEILPRHEAASAFDSSDDDHFCVSNDSASNMYTEMVEFLGTIMCMKESPTKESFSKVSSRRMLVTYMCPTCAPAKVQKCKYCSARTSISAGIPRLSDMMCTRADKQSILFIATCCLYLIGPGSLSQTILSGGADQGEGIETPGGPFGHF